MVWPVAVDASGHRAVAGPYSHGNLPDAARALRVWDLASGRERVHSLAHLTDATFWAFWDLSFAPDGSLYAAANDGVHRLSLPSEPGGAVSRETVYAAQGTRMDLSPDGKTLATLGPFSGVQEYGELHLFDLAGHTSRRVTTHGSRFTVVRFSPSGRVLVTGDAEGVVRVGPANGGEPHLLLGHEGAVYALALSPDERWIASATEESISIWPMPDVTKPPLHTLPHAELLAKLDALTNLRVVRDPASATGWKLDVGPFPGWQDVPTW
jgi:hypothetical protein